MRSIGVIGNGFVGNAVAKGFGDYANVRVYDVDSARSTHTLNETLNTEFVFVCLPTPMVNEHGGECNLSIIKDFFSSLDPDEFDGDFPVFIIKSTVPIGTTEHLQDEVSWLDIVHNPEFLTAANAEEDFVSADRTVIGGRNLIALGKVRELYQQCFPYIPIYTMSSNESESVKYYANCFLATKVIFFNEMKLLSEKFGTDYGTICEAVIADYRIGNSHWNVPGPDGNYGFGGTCFPKDTNALINTMEQQGLDPKVLKAVWEQNLQIRKNRDWATSKSAVLSVEE